MLQQPLSTTHLPYYPELEQLSSCVRQLPNSIVSSSSSSLTVGCLGSSSGLEYLPIIQQLVLVNNFNSDLDMISIYLNVSKSTNVNKLMRSLQVESDNHDQLLSTFLNTENPTKLCFPTKLLNILISYNLVYQLPDTLGSLGLDNTTNSYSLLSNLIHQDRSYEVSKLAQSELTKYLNLRHRELTSDGLLYLVLLKDLSLAETIQTIWYKVLDEFTIFPHPNITLPFYGYTHQELTSSLSTPNWTLLHLESVDLSHQSISELSTFHELTYPHLILGLKSSSWGRNQPDHLCHKLLANFYRQLKSIWSPKLNGWVAIAKKI